MTSAWASGGSSVMVRSMRGRVPGGSRLARRCAAPPVNSQRRAPAGQVDHAHVAPEDALAKTRAERLGAGFLGGEAPGVARRAQAPAVGPLALRLGEHAPGEALAEPLQRALDPGDVDQVAAEPDDHRARSMAARIRRTVSTRPTKIASPTRKWPILSSATVGIAATGPTLS